MNVLPERGEAGQPYLVEQDGRLTLAFSELAVQSTMDAGDPERLVLEYSQLMLASLLFVPAPAHIGMIGLGGGSLVKAVRRLLPDTRMTVAELSAEVIALRHRFHLPDDDERLSVLHVDGADWVARLDGELDLLWVDGFDTEGLAPALTTQRFFDHCCAALRDGGVMAMNIYARDPLAGVWVERIARAFARSVSVVLTPDGDNRVVFAARGDAFRLGEGTLARRAAALDARGGALLPGMARALVDGRRQALEQAGA